MKLVYLNNKTVGYWATWLDANVYFKNSSINVWLNSNKIQYKHRQDDKFFEWTFEKESDATFFVLRWN